MAMDEAEFREHAEAAIEELDKAFSRLANQHGFDTDVEGGVLKVSFEEPEQGIFVISSNAPARQIWVSARLSSFKFDWVSAEQRFALHGTGEPINSVLQRLVRAQLGDELIQL